MASLDHISYQIYLTVTHQQSRKFTYHQMFTRSSPVSHFRFRWKIGNVNTCSPDRSTQAQQSLIDVTESAQFNRRKSIIVPLVTRESKLLDLYSLHYKSYNSNTLCICTRDIRPRHYCHRFGRKNPIKKKQCRQIY